MGEIKIGRHTYGNPTRRGTGNNVTIGNYCSIAEGVLLDGGFNHNSKFTSTYPFHSWFPECSSLPSNILIKGDIEIGSDVWLGEQSVIMSGVKIGHGAVIGMRAIVSKDVKPYEIIVGAPQKVLRKRFTDEQIAKLLKIEWWNWPDEKVKENAHLLQSENIDPFIALHYNF
jgi:acetyltransferase-like isoleucine patch superfamily enzyme